MRRVWHFHRALSVGLRRGTAAIGTGSRLLAALPRGGVSASTAAAAAGATGAARRGYSVLVTRPIVDAGLDVIKAAGHDVHVVDSPTKWSEDDLIAHIARTDARAVVSLLSDPFTARVLAAGAARGLRVVAQYAVGLDNIDLAAAAQHNVAVAHTPGVLTDATADQAFALLLAANRHIVPGDAYVRGGKFGRWETQLMLGQDLRGKVLGIYGMGRIGQAMAQRGVGFGMRVCYTNRRRVAPDVEQRLGGAEWVPFDRLLRDSDVLSVHAPLTPATRHAFGTAQFAQMKPTSILINTGRGPVLNEAELAQALAQHSAAYVAGDSALSTYRGGPLCAGLDVYEREPAVHPALLHLPNVVHAPHLGSATRETRAVMSRMVGESVVAALADKPIPHRAPAP